MTMVYNVVKLLAMHPREEGFFTLIARLDAGWRAMIESEVEGALEF